MLHNKKLSQGRSMVEMLGVLGIMALITALGIIAYTQASQMFKIDRVKNEISTIRIHLQTKSDWGKFTSADHSASNLKANFDNFFISSGILNKNVTPLGSETYYGIATSFKSGIFQINIFNLSEKDCDAILDLYSNLSASQYNVCRYRNEIYEIVLHFEK